MCADVVWMLRGRFVVNRPTCPRNYVVYKLCSGYSSGGTYSCIGKNIVASNVEREATKTLDISVSKEVSVSLTPSRLDSTV